MGTTMGAMIQVREDLTRKAGDTVVFPTVRRLVGAGVSGNTVLEGNEEILNARVAEPGRLRVPARRRGLATGTSRSPSSISGRPRGRR